MILRIKRFFATEGRIVFPCTGIVLGTVWALCLVGCRSAGEYRKQVDETAGRIIQLKQQEALGRTEPFTIEKPSETLRRRLLEAQGLPYSASASLGTKKLKPIEHWPKDDYLEADGAVADASVPLTSGPLQLTLVEALQVAAANSREYQDQKENVFSAALRLDGERDIFRNTFTGALDGSFNTNESGDVTSKGMDGSGVLGIGRTLKNGIGLTAQIGMDVAKLLTSGNPSARATFADASITIPLLQGAGKHIVAERLTQAERDAVYAIWAFERYKRSFAVRVANDYLSVLQLHDSIVNAEQNYRDLIDSTRRARLTAEAGRLPPEDVDEAMQDELSARERWIRAQEALKRGKDQFKVLLGLPADAEIELPTGDIDRLRSEYEDLLPEAELPEPDVAEAGVDEPIVLQPATRENAGPYEIDESLAIQLAFENRLDLKTAEGRVYDAQRAVVVAADALKPRVTLFGNAGFGEHRSMGSATRPNEDWIDVDKGVYSFPLSIDLPLERTDETIAYRESLLSLEREVRNFQETEDQIKLEVRNDLRNLLEFRLGLEIQAQALALAERRVVMTDMLLNAGRTEMRIVLDAKRARLSAQNSLTSAIIDYRMAELELQRDLGLLQVDDKGLWTEFSPPEVNDEQQK